MDVSNLMVGFKDLIIYNNRFWFLVTMLWIYYSNNTEEEIDGIYNTDFSSLDSSVMITILIVGFYIY